MRVELQVDLRRCKRQPLPDNTVDKAERLRLNREERRLRQIALAQHIDYLIVSGQVESLAEIARICGVSRAGVSQLIGLVETDVPG